jgi:hypothetical protein
MNVDKLHAYGLLAAAAQFRERLGLCSEGPQQLHRQISSTVDWWDLIGAARPPDSSIASECVMAICPANIASPTTSLTQATLQLDGIAI